MSLKKLVNDAISLIAIGSHEDVKPSSRAWISQEQVFYVTDTPKYDQLLEKIYELDKVITSRFARATIFEFVNK